MTSFPDPSGLEFERAVSAGADTKTVVPDDFVIVKGGSGPIPIEGTPFSAAVGPSLDAAAAGVPHGQVRISTVGAIRAQGGTVDWCPELSRHGTINQQHVNVTEAGPSAFGETVTNPVPRPSRIDGDKK